MTNETVDDVLKKLKGICATLEKPPVIFLDYLQIIPSKQKDAKSAADDTARKLKVFQRDTGTIAFESFKESGGIEFSADIIWGLQFYATKELKDAGTQKNREIIDAAKAETPRKVHLKCLKNRNGALYDCYFKYYSASDYFEPCEESDFKNDSPDEKAKER